MIRSLWKEEWKDVKFDEKISDVKKFKISNYGRVLYCKDDKEFLRKKSFINRFYHISHYFNFVLNMLAKN